MDKKQKNTRNLAICCITNLLMKKCTTEELLTIHKVLRRIKRKQNA